MKNNVMKVITLTTTFMVIDVITIITIPRFQYVQPYSSQIIYTKIFKIFVLQKHFNEYCFVVFIPRYFYVKAKL